VDVVGEEVYACGIVSDADDDRYAVDVVSYKKEARTLRVWVGNNPRPITQEVFSP